MRPRRRPLRWSDIPAGVRRFCRDPSNLAGVGIGLAAGIATYVAGDKFVDYVMRPGMSASSYAHLNDAMQYIRGGIRLAEIAGSGYVAWKAGGGGRDLARRIF